jgi:glycosyltransferase involved in cell wall biosynthesis
MAALGIKNEVACCDAPSATWMEHDQFPIHALGPGRFGFSYSKMIHVWIKENYNLFDAIVLHGMWQWPGLSLLRSAVPRFFLMPHGMLDPWFQRDASRRFKSFRNYLYWWMFERHVVNRASGVLFTCEEEMRLARTTFSGYRPQKEINVGYGIAPAPDFTEKMGSAFAEKLPTLKGRPYLLFLGRIHPKKGVDLLVRAYKEIMETQKSKAALPDLVIAGPGWESEFGNQVREQIDDANSGVPTQYSSRIHMVGMLEGNAKWGAIYGCMAFILPSHQENFGIAVVEALACGRPVLISNKVNIWREIAEHGAGLVEEDTLRGTSRLIQRFAQGESAGTNTERFRDCFVHHFGIEQATKNLLNALQAS